jgi:uncharacterized repeat protein (TIGR02543 family)
MDRKHRFHKWILFLAIASVTSVGWNPFIPTAFAGTLSASDAPTVTSSGVVQVFNAAQLEYIDQNQNLYLNSNIELMNNIDLSTYRGWLPIGGRFSGTDAGGKITYTPSLPESSFSGTFDGQGHVITGLVINDTSDVYIGVFGLVSGTIKNVGIDGQVTTANYTSDGITIAAGMMAGELRNGSIHNSYGTGAVSQGYANGGLVGMLNGSVTNSYSMVNVSGSNITGGLAGVFVNGSITDSYAVGSVSGHTVGGIVGAYYGGTFAEDFFGTSTTRIQQGGGISGVTGLSTNTMETPSTFAGWSTGNWAMYAGQYPLLSWQVPLTISSLATPTNVLPGGQVSVKGSVYSIDGAPLSGINVTLSDIAGGSWQYPSVTTDSSGSYTDTWIAPNTTTIATVTANVYGTSALYQSAIQVQAFTVTYNGNYDSGGTVPTDSKTYTSGMNATVLGNTGNLTRTGYTFAGWNTKSDGSGTSYSGGNLISIGSENVILYAQWTTRTPVAISPFSVGTSFVWNGQYGVPYVPFQLQAESGFGPDTWSILSGSLPKGLTLSSSGVITGTPMGPNGTSTFTVQVKDASGRTASQSLSILIQGAPNLSVTPTIVPGGWVENGYSTQLQTPEIWTLESGTLPPGLSLSTRGVLSGTPTEGGTYTFTVQVMDASGVPVKETLSMVVESINPHERLVSWNGTTNAVPAIVRENTTYMPIWYVMQYLKSMGVQSEWDGSHWRMTTQNQTNLTARQVGRGATSIYLNGTLVQEIDTVAATDPSTGHNTMYMPIWYVMQVLKRVGLHSTWNGTTWTVTRQNS